MVEDDEGRLIELLPEGERVLTGVLGDKEAEDRAVRDDDQIAFGVAFEHIVNPTLEPL
jgi:hypothetical protein